MKKKTTTLTMQVVCGLRLEPYWATQCLIFPSSK
jgi:hypothetical protein